MILLHAHVLLDYFFRYCPGSYVCDMYIEDVLHDDIEVETGLDHIIKGAQKYLDGMSCEEDHDVVMIKKDKLLLEEKVQLLEAECQSLGGKTHQCDMKEVG